MWNTVGTLLTRLGSLAALGIAASAIAFTPAALADDAEAPLQLGSEHLGMTSEAIEKVEEEAHTEEVVEQAIEQSEWSDEDLGIEPEAAFELECPPVEPAAAGVQTTAVGVSDYTSCLEVAIRAGNGFKAASSVCKALFPELPAPSQPDLSANGTTY